MSILLGITSIVSIYLFYVLVNPEKF
ncbi:potassium-transporting ATPase subunit F [Cytobacillus oceanisediminis]